MNNTLLGTAVSLITLVGFGLNVGAQAPGTSVVRGRISDWQGCPLEGASIHITDGAGQTLGSAKSETEGKYSISGLPLGSKRMEVTFPGFSGERFEPWIAADLVTDVGLGLVAVDDTSAMLEGRVIDSAGRAIPDATVYVMPIFAPGWAHQQRTDRNGHFRTRLHKPGQFAAIAAKGGYIGQALVLQIVSFVAKPAPVRLILESTAHACSAR